MKYSKEAALRNHKRIYYNYKMTWPWKSLRDLIESEKWIEVEQRIQTTKGKKEVKEKNDRQWLPLHSACYNKAPYSTVKALLDEYPDAASVIDSRKNLPLHYAVLMYCSFDVIELLLQLFPTGVSSVNSKGWIPIHIACFVLSPLQIIEALCDPETVKTENPAGNLPLHLAIQSGAGKEITDFLLRQNPNGAEVTNKRKNRAKDVARIKGQSSMSSLDASLSQVHLNENESIFSGSATVPTVIELSGGIHQSQLSMPMIEEGINTTATLTQLIKDSDWRACSIRLQTEIGRREASYINGDDSGWVPLHTALYNQAPFMLIEELLSINNEAVAVAANDGKVALHFACYCKASLEVIKLIAEALPDAVRFVDNDGYLPIHFIACDVINLQRLDTILKLYPIGAQKQNKSGQLPIHLCCNSAVEFTPIELLYSGYTDGIFQSDKQGLLPLHYACNEDASETVIERIIQLCPDAVRCEDDIGALPLHIACQNSASLDVINILLKAYPDAALHSDQDGWTPLFFAYNSSTIVIDSLLRYHKYNVDNDGCLPLHVACFNKAPVENIETLILDYPQALKIPDNQGRLPIHYLCMNPTYEALNLLRTYGSYLANVTDHKNRLPIHYACLNASSSTTKSIMFLLSLNPSSIESIDDYGNLPLHYLCKVDEAPFSLIKDFINRYPESLCVKNKDGEIPLHRVSYNQPKNSSLMQYLLKRNPTTAFIMDINGKMPLDITIDNSNSGNDISMIKEFYRNEGILVVKNEKGRYHPQLAYGNNTIKNDIKEFV